MHFFRKTALSLSLLSAAPLALSGCGETNAQSADKFANVEVKAVKLGNGVGVLFGQGGNIGVSHGDDGLVLIDDQFAGLTDKIKAALKEGIGTDKVDYLINTHWHFDHTGGNENFGKDGAIIVAHDNVRKRLINGNDDGAGKSPAPDGLPVITFKDHHGPTLHLNGETMHILHMPHGHTDGDSVVWWRNANIVHMGDLYFNKVTLPFIDLKSGGDARGILSATERVLARIDDKTQIIPGHGPMANKADLAEYRDMLKGVIGAVEKAKAEGKSLKEVVEMKPAAKWDTNPKAFIKGDAFVVAVYKSLDRKK